MSILRPKKILLVKLLVFVALLGAGPQLQRDAIRQGERSSLISDFRGILVCNALFPGFHAETWMGASLWERESEPTDRSLSGIQDSRSDTQGFLSMILLRENLPIWTKNLQRLFLFTGVLLL